MEQATEKQIKFATSLGISNPETFSKQALKELINQKVGDKPSDSQKTLSQPSNQPKEAIVSNTSTVLNKVEKPHSYEFGPANNRHKVYYSDFYELKSHIENLRHMGLLDEEPKIE